MKPFASIITIPLALAAAGGVGLIALRLTHRPAYIQEMVPAGIACLAASLLAVLLPMLRRPEGQAAVVQGAFQGMVAHFLASAILGVAIGWLAHVLTRVPFAVWLLWFFWASLITVSSVLVHLIRSTPMATQSAMPGAANGANLKQA